ncbi:chalcone isomerase family protein [Flammeovirga agarivorans]|uniref:Chalcone isomerase domain-containing protein n=1 Tax=Flammeovirga agarivorans TaxID=2726742 RepID=A0A7X8SNQ4_9BACT|nr:chalcone isomerase family protein [Flammeovirga agarivorans]NLR93606.1 hypothetical protein [Flammeovirga agarivorans]
MIRRFFVLTFLGAIILTNSFAQTSYKVNLLFNIDFPDQVTIENDKFILNGEGSYIQGVHKLFACGLYVKEKSDDPVKIIYSEDTKIFELVVTTTQFQSQKTIDEIKNLHEENKDLLKKGEITTLISNVKNADVALPSNFVESVNFFEKAFDGANRGNTDDYHGYIEEFIQLFEDKNLLEDHYRLTFLGENRVIIYKNSQKVMDVQDKAFPKALFNIFIGNDATNKRLKGNLLHTAS